MKFLKKYVDPWVRLYSIIPLISVFAFNCLIYWGTMSITADWYHFDFTTKLDRMVPLVPWTIVIYLGCYLFWAVNYIMAGHLEKKEFYRFVTADLLSRVVCGIFFVVLPTTNVRPELPTDSDFLSGNAVAVEHGSGGKPVSVHPLPGKLVLLYCDPRE